VCDWPQSADQPLISHLTECLAAYDMVTFSMFIEVFRYLPLATIIESQVRVKISCSANVDLTLLVFDRSVCTFTYNRISK